MLQTELQNGGGLQRHGGYRLTLTRRWKPVAPLQDIHEDDGLGRCTYCGCMWTLHPLIVLDPTANAVAGLVARLETLPSPERFLVGQRA